MYWHNITFFQSSRNVPSSSIVLKIKYRGKAIDFPHNCIIPVDISHPWALLALRFLIITWRSFSLIPNDFNQLFVLKLKTGSVLVFWTRVHCSAKCRLNSSAFLWKSDTSLLLTRRGGIFGIFFFIQKSVYYSQYVFDVVSRKSNFELILAI